MKLKEKILVAIFLLSSVFTWAQQDPVKVKDQELYGVQLPDPKYKSHPPDSTQFPITQKDLLTLCRALNLSREDSLKCPPDKIWMALTQPERYHKTFTQARLFLWDSFERPFLAGWALNDERPYAERILLEGFFSPLIYGLYLNDLDKTYSWLTDPKELSKLSALRGLKERSQWPNLSGLKGQKARQALVLLNKLLKPHGSQLLLLHPGREKEFPFDGWQVISVRQGLDKEVVRIFRQLGVKASAVGQPANQR